MYTYPDRVERIVGARIGRDPRNRVWVRERRWVEEEVEHAVRRVWGAAGCEPRVGVDIGAGRGRLIPWIASLGLRPIAVEPDPERLSGAARMLPPGGAAILAFGDDVPLPDGSACLVLISHVLQHVPRDVAPKILREARRLLVRGGALAVYVSHSERWEEYFQAVTEGYVREISGEEYDELARWPRLGVLPVRKFNPGDFLRMVERAGFRVEGSFFYRTRERCPPVERVNELDARAAAACTYDLAVVAEAV